MQTRKTIFFCFIFCLVTICLFACPALASDPELKEAQAYAVMNDKGDVLFSKNADQQFDPASITKIMTAVVALDSGKNLDDVCHIEERNYQEGAQLIGFKATDTPTFSELLYATLVYSGNDAADALMYNTFGSVEAGVARMNEKAKSLGLSNTHFANPHGLIADGHKSSAHDLVVLARYAYQNYPLIRQIVSTREITLTVGGEQKTFHSTDALMDTYSGLRGMKTGSVETGYTFMGASYKNGIMLFTAVLGCASSEGRFSDTAALMDWAYQNYYPEKTLLNQAAVSYYYPFAYCFGYEVKVAPLASATGRIEKNKSYSFKRTLASAGTLLGLGQAVGVTTFEQDGRAVAGCVYQSSGLQKTLAINPFARSLFA